MNPTAVRGAALVVVGIAIGLFVAAWVRPGDGRRAATARPPSRDAAPAVASRDGGLERRLDRLAARLDDEIAARRRLAEEIDSLAAQLAARAESVPAAPADPAPSAPLPAAAPVAAESDSGDERSAIEQAMVAAGVDPELAAEIRRRSDQVELDEIYLRDLAAREQWLGSERFREEMAAIREQQPSIRGELGDELYDRYLDARGEANRVVVDEVLLDSPAAAAGLQAGDLVLRYGEARIFAPGELVTETRGGTAGETVRIQILRGGVVVEVDVPRGPLGVRIAGTRVDPGGG